MKKRFIQYITDLTTQYKDKKYLLAVSGGKDSCVMAYLFASTKLHFDIAHCNFNLRGKDSIRDKEFVIELANRYNVTCYTQDFDTLKIQEKSGKSIEMVARELRYKWFEIIGNKYDYIVTAHHANDNAETILLNMIRGTGIKGMTGIPSQNGKIIRPFLSFTSKEINDFALENNISFCEDYTNYENNYRRNKLRNIVIPQLTNINPNFINIIDKNTRIWKRQYEFYQKQIILKTEKYLHKEDHHIYFNIEELDKEPFKDLILYENLTKYGFKESQIQDILNSFNSQSGKKFYSKTHLAYKERNKIVLSEKDKTQAYFKQYFSFEEMKDDKYLIDLISIKEHKSFETNNNIAYFDADKIIFPITVRNWKTGDCFYPFGMKGKMKVSDFFNNLKIDNYKKNNIKIMCSQKNIIWIVGYRSDERYKVDTQKTKLYYKINAENCE